MLSNKKNTSFGEYIRQLREERNLPLRTIASELDIDTSTLSKIEKNERNANEQILEKLSEIFSLDKADLKIRYISDKISYQLLDEENGIEILKIAGQKIKYYKQSQS
jgi:transcriptional regulator with XRE-family HTH domain